MGEVKLGSFMGGKVGVVSQMRGVNRGSGNRSSNSQVYTHTHTRTHTHTHTTGVHFFLQVTNQRERQISPARATSPPRGVGE